MDGPDSTPPHPAALLSADPDGESNGSALARVLERMPAAFCFLDTDWRIRYVNAEAERLTGHRRSHLLDRLLAEALPATAGSDFERSLRAATRSGQPVSFEATVPGCSDGWYEVRAWPGPDGLAVYCLDVSARHRAEESATRAAARTALLNRVVGDLSGALDGASALGRLARLVVPTLADACIVTVVDRLGRPRDIGSWHADPDRRAALQRYTQLRLETMPATSPVARALAAGIPVTDSAAAVLALLPHGPARDLLVELRPESVVVLPLIAESRTVGVLTLYQDPGRQATDQDLQVAHQVAAQAARAVERVHRQSQQAQLAEELQRSLLTDPPTIEGVDVVVRYVPAAEAARVGGDWYDAFLQRDGRPVVVIGDVVGHDTAAAAAMGQLRGLLRGIAHYSGAGPAEVLHGLDDAVVHMHTETLATAVVARVEPGTDGGLQLRWANAGHPPPVVVPPEGDPTLLGDGVGDLLLGVDPTARRAEWVLPLRGGETLLLYTDGLVERRDNSIDVGLDRLTEVLAELREHPLAELCDGLLARMVEEIPQDDIALVALRLHRASGELPRHG